MRSLLFALGILLVAKTAGAETPWRVNIFPLNAEVRYERDSSQQMVDRQPVNFAFGVRQGPSTVLFEYSKFNETTGNATLSLDRSHEEYIFWWKQNILNTELVDFFISGGAGAYTEKVTTTLSGSGSTTDSSGLQPVGGASAGVHSVILKYVLISFEGRLMAGKNFDPNPQAGMLLRLGVEF